MSTTTSNPPQGQVTFKKVSPPNKKMLLREIAGDHLSLMVKGAGDEPYELTAVQVQDDESMICHHSAHSKVPIKNEPVTVNFAFKNERYFFKSELRLEGGRFILTLKDDLYRLQRRLHARIILPRGYDGAFILHQHEGKKLFLDSFVKDISAGGLRIEIPEGKIALKTGEKIKGSLRLGTRRPMDFDLEVRYAKKRDDQGRTYLFAGLQFLNIDKIMENRLLGLVQDLQREIFLNFSDDSGQNSGQNS